MHRFSRSGIGNRKITHKGIFAGGCFGISLVLRLISNLRAVDVYGAHTCSRCRNSRQQQTDAEKGCNAGSPSDNGCIYVIGVQNKDPLGYVGFCRNMPLHYYNGWKKE